MGYLPVIPSAGSIGTLQLLMLPGIGPEKDLQSIGTQTLVDLPCEASQFLLPIDGI